MCSKHTGDGYQYRSAVFQKKKIPKSTRVDSESRVESSLCFKSSRVESKRDLGDSDSRLGVAWSRGNIILKIVFDVFVFKAADNENAAIKHLWL